MEIMEKDKVDEMSKDQLKEMEKVKEVKGICWVNVLSCLTMPLEGIFFFGIIMGWPNLAEIYKDLGIYESACDPSLNSTIEVNGTINCPARDVIFT